MINAIVAMIPSVTVAEKMSCVYDLLPKKRLQNLRIAELQDCIGTSPSNEKKRTPFGTSKHI